MFRRRIFVKIVFQLHQISCPGVWLCRHGFVEVTIKTLGYLLRTSAMEPKFPLLPHDEFKIKGYFKSVGNIEELQSVLATEKIEITLWQNGQRLAYFIGKLLELMQTDMMPKLHCKQNMNIKLLMKATPVFPGIITPKMELSVSSVVRDRLSDCKNRCETNWNSNSASSATRSIDYSCQFISTNFQSKANLAKTNHHNCKDYPETKRRQLPVCHARHCSVENSMKEKGYTSTGYFQADTLSHNNIQRRLSESSGKTFLSSHCSSSTRSDYGSENSWSDDMSLHEKIIDEHQDNCEICLNYRRTFMDTKI